MKTPRKNILFILTDQQRFDTVGWQPESCIDTPHLTKLMSEGHTFLDCTSVNPLCSPARSALLTGRYAHQINMRTMSGELSPQYPTVPMALQKSGYRTALYGKTHWWQGWDWFDGNIESHYDMRKLNPQLTAYGFDKLWEGGEKRALGIQNNDYTDYLAEKGYGEEYTEYYSGISGATFRIEKEVNEKTAPFPFPEENQAEAVITSKVIEEIEAQAGSLHPFCIFAHYFAPHDPFDPPQRFLDQVPYEEKDDFVQRPGQKPLTPDQKKQLWKLRQGYRALVLMLDEQIGRIFTALQERGLLEDTVILFSSDHGELMGDHGFTQKGLPWKQSAQVPAAIRHPDFLHAKSICSPVECTDLSATILEVAGLDVREALGAPWPSYLDHIPSKSLMPIIRGEADQVRDYAFSECDLKWHDAAGYQDWSWQMVLNEHWKYVRYVDRKAATPATSRREVLIDRLNDRDEVRDVSNRPEHQEILEQLRVQLDFINDTTPTAQTSWIPFECRRKGFSV